MNIALLLFLHGFFLSLVGVFFFLAPSTVSAQLLTLTPPLEHEGLTFSEPLTFSQSPMTPLVLSFEQEETLSLKPHSGKSVLAEAIVSPSPTKQRLKTPASLVPPTVTKEQVTLQASPKASPPTPLPTATPTPHPEQRVASSANSGGLDPEKLFSMANAYRAERGLPPFQKDERSCQLAQERAPEVAGEVASGALHSGLHARNLPYWNTENIISMRTEEEAFNWWINDHIHWKAIVGNFTYSCVACSGNNCAQEFTNYQPK